MVSFHLYVLEQNICLELVELTQELQILACTHAEIKNGHKKGGSIGTI